jgi:hypothetical protein
MAARLALLLSWVLPLAAQAAAPDCQVFVRDSADAPAEVREWLQSSGDARVRVCQLVAGNAATAVFTGEGAVSRSGEVCSYASHGLTSLGAAQHSRLRRYESDEMRAMLLGEAACPLPHASGAPTYTLTYQVSPQVFEAVMRWWRTLLQSAAPQLPEAAAGTAGARLRAALAAGRLRGVAVLRLVRIPGSWLRHRYTLFVADPEQAPSGAYVIYLSKRPRAPWQVTGVADTAL